MLNENRTSPPLADKKISEKYIRKERKNGNERNQEAGIYPGIQDGISGAVGLKSMLCFVSCSLETLRALRSWRFSSQNENPCRFALSPV
jgi:hypothetical protein